MSNVKLFAWLTVVSESVGFGMVFGYLIGNGNNTAALWISGILIFLGAVTLGMSISTRSVEKTAKKSKVTQSAQKTTEDEPEAQN
jgi:F0F1-type ATP synthase assembly protein I